MSNPKYVHVSVKAKMKLDRCPKAWINAESRGLTHVISDVAVFHKYGALPYSGGWLDQHPHWAQAATIISGVDQRG